VFRTELEAAVHAGIITADQAARLLSFIDSRAAKPGVTTITAPVVAPARFDFSHVLWYAGALIVIGALGLFTTVAFGAMGPRPLTLTAIGYAAGLSRSAAFFGADPA
jgi:hypothetical protein